LSLEDKVAFEKYYLEHKSLLFDIQIFFKTFTNAFFGKGVKH
jgi:lipopolysaccharide/colanic/teichoic acid biosynthesis glycosyltransferase